MLWWEDYEYAHMELFTRLPTPHHYCSTYATLQQLVRCPLTRLALNFAGVNDR